MTFDSHAHVISQDAERYRRVPQEGKLLPADFDDPMTAERLLREMDAAGVERAALVQRAHVYGFDNSYVCDAAASHPDRLSAVCAIDAAAADAGERVRYWIEERGGRGIRFMEPFEGADLSWFSLPAARAAWEAAAALGAPVCVHFFPWNREAGLAALRPVLEEFREIPVVLDHLSNIVSDSGPPDHGVDDLLRGAAGFANVAVKFTTIPLGRLNATGIDAAPVIRRVVDLFGADRVMWGSDIAQSKGSYGRMMDLAGQATRHLSEQERRIVLREAAHAVYSDRRRKR